MSLYDYMQATQRLVGFDERQFEYNPADLVIFINQARRQVAAHGECTRWLTPASAPIATITVVHSGQNYSAPIVTISPPDASAGEPPNSLGVQATATVTQAAGHINSTTLTNPGEGYFNPIITITDPTGSGAMLSATLGASLNQALPQQEIYRFSDINLTRDTGASALLSVRNITLLWGTQQYMLQPVSYSTYARSIRSFSKGFLGPPQYWCQFTQGTQGTIRIFPVPNQHYAMQWDCIVLPIDLQTEADIELIPDPWRDAVPFYAAYLALLSRSAKLPSLTPLVDRYYNIRDGGLFGDMMRRARKVAQPQQSWVMY